MNRSRRSLGALGALALVIAALQPALTSAQSPSAPAPAMSNCPNPHGADGKCKVVLVNSYLGNDYRIQMQKSADSASKHEPFASEWEFSILNTENTPEAQNAGLENLLAQGVDAILLNAVSDTSASEVVQKACDQGVLVVTFDITDKAGAACEYRIDFSFKEWATDAGKWMAMAMGGEGNVIMDKGLQGVSIAQDIYDGGLEGMRSVGGDNIKVVGEYFGEFAEGVQEPLISALLATNPEVDAVFTQGYCTTVFSAFKAAGRTPPVVYCQGYNSNALALAEEGNKGFITAGSFAGSIGAMETAYDVFHGKPRDKEQGWGVQYMATDTSFDIGKPYDLIEIGKNAFPDLPLGFGVNYNWSGPTQITIEEATGGS